MKFVTTNLPGVCVIEPEPATDERGFFARVWCKEELRENGVCSTIAQSSVSHNNSKGTVRGIHFQRSPYEEAKIVRCERGALFDVAVDLRPHSATYLQWFGVELSAEKMNALYVPEGFGHGFQTLCDDTRILYHISKEYTPNSGAGLRYDDPKIGITWPLEVTVVSEKDQNWSLLD